ncbi:MAG: HDIG domain-containing protein [Desulfuromonadaceae bacterium]|nr:HDIG domain-containing protein [Desulfuromonadaceae bacterium]
MSGKIISNQPQGTQQKVSPRRGEKTEQVNVLRRQRYAMLFILALILAMIIVPLGGFIPVNFAAGDIATRDIKAPRDFLVPVPELTEEKRQQAASAVTPVYDFDRRPSRALAQGVSRVLQIYAPTTSPIATVSQNNSAVTALDQRQAMVQELLGTELSAEQYSAVTHLAAKPQFVQQFSSVVIDILSGYIVGSTDLFFNNWTGAITLKNLASGQESLIADIQSIRSRSATVAQLRSAVEVEKGMQQDFNILLDIIHQLLRPNLTFNQSETEQRRKESAAAVSPVLSQVKRGEMIVREGERVSVEQARLLQILQGDAADVLKTVRTVSGLWLAIVLLFYAMHKFAHGNIRKYRPDTRDLLFLVMVIIASFVLAKLGIFTSTAMQSAFPYIDSGCYYYALPFAAAAMLVRIVLNSETAMVFSVLFALLIGLLFADNLFVALYVLVGSLVAAHSVKYCMSRSSLFRAGLILSVANMVTVTAIFAVEGHPFDTQFLYATGFAFCGGFISALLVNGTIPLAEAVFKYTTDFKLMELANMNTPILRELMIQAPGTYHHSIMVGLLVENAAESIGANPLLARVAAYYHDIGKVKKPLYFSENIKNQENRHDKLAPSMSALILTSHVKDGVELARESKLGSVLIEIIRQHHGTSLIKFFYEKAQQQAKDEVVNEQDYRYPGPKPQSREAALIMLADSVEAAGRTLSNPTSARIQGMVQKIINNIFIDGQLNECDLTLMDLHKIAKSFNRILVGIFHQRVEYPEPAYKERIKEDKKTTSGELKGKSSGDIDRESTGEPSNKPGEVTTDSTEDLRRLGMS